MTQQELEQIILGVAAKVNASGKQFAAALANLAQYSDREDLALKTRQDALEKRIAQNEADHAALDEAEVIALANRIRKEFEEAGVDITLLNNVLEKVRTNEVKLTELVGKVDTLRAEMDAANRDIKRLDNTQTDHGKRIKVLEEREDKVGLTEERASELDRAAVGAAFKKLATAIEDIAIEIEYTTPVTGEPFEANGFRMVKVAEADEAVAVAAEAPQVDGMM